MADAAHVSHHIPGRLRIKVPRAKGNARMLGRIGDALSPLEAVRRVEVNPTTGSLLVHYDVQAHPDFHQALAEQAEAMDLFSLAPPEVGEVAELAARVEQEAEFLAAHSETALSVVNAVRSLNRGIREASGNAVDLKVLVPGALAVWAFLKSQSQVSTPLWVTLAMFSFNSFVALHRPTPIHMAAVNAPAGTVQ